jgi:hypothetical protein
MSEAEGLIERLRPAFANDLVVQHAIDRLREEECRNTAQALSEWLVQNNELRRAAATALQQAISERERAELDRQASDLAIQYVSVTLGGTDEWSDQANMVYSIRQLADETAAQLQRLTASPAATPAWILDFLNRRTEVERELRDIKRGKRETLTPDEAWDLANRLSVPSEFGATPLPAGDNDGNSD